LLAQRKSNQKEMASSTNQSYDRSGRGDFSKGHPCPLEKRRTSCAAPSGSAIAAGCEAHLKGAGPNQSQRPWIPAFAGMTVTALTVRWARHSRAGGNPRTLLLAGPHRSPRNELPERWPQGRGVRSSGTWMSRVPRKDRMSSAGRSTPRPCGQRRSVDGCPRHTSTSRWIPAFAGMTVAEQRVTAATHRATGSRTARHAACDVPAPAARRPD